MEFDGPQEGFELTFYLSYSGLTIENSYSKFDWLLNRILPGGSNDGLDLHTTCAGPLTGQGSCELITGSGDGFPVVSILESWTPGLVTFEITNPVG